MTPSPARGRSPRGLRPALVAGAAATALLLTGCSGGAGAAGAGDTSGNQLLTIPREDMGTFTRNFNPFSPKAAPMTKEAVYEPLMVHNPADGKDTPWLATAWTQAPDGKSVTFTLREGVKWSDGKPFAAEDVVHTFELQKKLLGGFEYLDEVTADSPQKVTFHFNKPFSPSLYEIGGHYIVPKHIWSKIADPAKDTNATPVGTGPYTQVEHFQSQSYELRKNPSYWQPAKQRIAGIRLLAFSGNDSANLAFTNGEVDWTQAFIPDIQKSFVAKNPKTNHYWFPTTGAMINWQLNTAKAPFDDPALRKALSRAVDRAKIAKVAMNGYSVPADCTGLSNAYDTWRDKTVAASCDWTTHDSKAAAQALDAAGYKLGAGGRRTQKNGKPLTLDISVGSASSDWISVANIIKQNLAEVGVTATVKSPDWSAVVSSYETGTFDSGIVWSNNGATPYEFYRGAMATTQVKPVGEKATENYHRFGDPKADRLIDAFAATTDPKTQQARAGELQKLFAADAPVVPLFPGPEWGAYTDARFTGWPTKDDPYATLSNRSVTTVLVLTSLRPVKG
ncbi:ABC transporter substrate-binding protein [Streptomyces vietnamensis]|uniref:ABC transporter substrate-binding protein n=1 Tax=Streptomyces vietnamensis TaxID=362257 RepID=A0A0B5HSV5_9ACTN|nr:ABC transporter substrate-binding protein [Streptomyces vietnamensis]AJF63571.1 ABC transporter substrate-binding protein [Streptomyces vietnamensis]